MKYKKIALVACSNGLQPDEQKTIEKVIEYLKHIDIEVVCSQYIYVTDVHTIENAERNAAGEDRARVLMDFFMDSSIEAIFDVSGGDLANEVLPYLGYAAIKENPKPFYGYSDLSTVCNAIAVKAGISTGLFQIKTVIWDESEFKKRWFERWNGKTDIETSFLRGESMSGICIGGNIRCFLKLAGTEYIPDLAEKILVLESYGGLLPQVITLVTQLSQMRGFDKLNGIILGAFTKLDEAGQRKMLLQEVLRISKDIPIAVTTDIGHDKMCKCVMIGDTISI